MHFRLIPILALTLLIAGCDVASILGPDPRVAQREADARAIGAACRYAMRGIEDCYKLNERAPKNSIFEGWKEMDRYMRENKMEGVASKIDAPSTANEATMTDSTESKKAASH
jgi:hypothetical protein